MNWATDIARGNRATAIEHRPDNSINYECPEDGGRLKSTRLPSGSAWVCTRCGWCSAHLEDARKRNRGDQ